MKSMNLFDRNGESSETLFGNTKPKEDTKLKKKIYSEDFKKKAISLASKIGFTKAAEELGVSTSSIYSWQKTLGTFTLAKNTLAKKLPPAPIQDADGNLTFELEGKMYSLNVNSEEERELVKKEVNANSLTKYDWFKEKTGKKHWVFYNTKMYEICNLNLQYREDSDLAPIVPINATSCYGTFFDCKKLTSIDLSNFNTRNVTDMNNMFYNCKRLTSLNLNGFDTSNVNDMCGMFSNCLKLTSLDLSNFNTSQVINMGGMFGDCKQLISLDLSSFDTSRVINMSGMFDNCQQLISLDLTNFNTSKVLHMSMMFRECLSLTSLDLINFDTRKVLSMSGMFKNCKALAKLDLSNFDTSTTTDMGFMFKGCSHLAMLDLSNFDIRYGTYIESMFENCKSLTTIYISDKWNTDEAVYSENVFEGCDSIPNFNPEKIDIEMAKPKTEGGYLTLKK